MSSCLICDAHQQQSLENAWDQDNHLNHCTIDVPFSDPYCILKKPKDWVKNHLIEQIPKALSTEALRA